MLFSPVVSLLLASLVPTVYSQQLSMSAAQAAIVGTWSSGSKHVMTGPNFANPLNLTFNYPATTGISYSFTTDNNYEIARYRFTGNGSEPTCITGVIGWSHGTYQFNANGSMSLMPLRDGFQQIQDPCAPVSNFIEDYMITLEYYQMWQIFQDPTTGLKLHLFAYDGSPLSPMFQVSTTPNMLPTQQLRNVSNPDASPTSSANTNQRRSESGAVGKSWFGAMGTSSLLVMALASLML